MHLEASLSRSLRGSASVSAQPAKAFGHQRRLGALGLGRRNRFKGHNGNGQVWELAQ